LIRNAAETLLEAGGIASVYPEYRDIWSLFSELITIFNG
jgi:hypothetical protein